VPREASAAQARALGLAIVPLTDPWAERRFVVCFRARESLSAAARLLAEYLSEVRDEFRAPSAPGQVLS
jgi:DNA-binding transcriptional LysR family regulator